MLQYPFLCQRKWNPETVVQQRMSGNQQFQGGLEGPQPLHFKSAAATCAVRGDFLRSGACAVGFAAPGKQASGLFSARNGPAGPGRPSILNPQQRHARCGAVSARKWSRWLHFSEQRAGRPRAEIFAERSGVRSARKTGQWVARARKIVLWTIFTEQRAGKPWVVFSENGPAGPGNRRGERQIRSGGGIGGGRIPSPIGSRIHA